MKEHKEAQFKLAECYELGIGVPKRADEALKWYRKAAINNHTAAQVVLVKSYLYGKLGPRNIREAIKWSLKIENDIEPEDLNNIGHCFDIGDGVERFPSEAVRYYKKAAERGCAIAQFNMGVCYEQGSGVAKNLNTAKKWYQKAAAQGDKNALKRFRDLSYISMPPKPPSPHKPTPSPTAPPKPPSPTLTTYDKFGIFFFIMVFGIVIGVGVPACTFAALRDYGGIEIAGELNDILQTIGGIIGGIGAIVFFVRKVRKFI